MWSCPPIWDRSAGFAARRSLWACANPDQPPRRPALGRKDGPPRYSAPDVSPADPCNKMANDPAALRANAPSCACERDRLSRCGATWSVSAIALSEARVVVLAHTAVLIT